MSAPTTSPRAWRNLPWRRIAVHLGLITLLSVFQYFGEIYVFNNFLGLGDWQGAILARFYDQVIKSDPRSSQPRHTAVVKVSNWNRDAGPCAIRQHLSRVLPAILRTHPRAVVVDATLQPGIGCRVETESLLRIIHEACLKDDVIVFGYDLAAGPRVLPYEPIEPVTVQPSKCTMGFTNPERDLRRIPLSIKALDQTYPSLSWAAVRMVEPEFLTSHPDISRSWEKGEPMYSPLMSVGEYSRQTVQDDHLLSGRFPVERLKGRVVIVGFEGDDVVDTSAGKTPGYLLHASYVEALLDETARAPWPYNLAIGVNLGLMLFVDGSSLILRDKYKHRGVLYALGALMLALLAALAFSLISVHRGYYDDFGFLSIGSLFIWVLNSVETLTMG